MLPILLALSAAKMIQDKNNQDQETKQNIADTRFSPWTHQNPASFTKVTPANGIGTLEQGVAAGVQDDQNQQAQKDAKEFRSAWLDLAAKNSKGGAVDPLSYVKGAEPEAALPASPPVAEAAPGPYVEPTSLNALYKKLGYTPQ